MTEEDKMLAGQFYNSMDDALVQKRDTAQALCLEYNTCLDPAQRTEILRRLLGGETDNVMLQGPIHFTYGCFTSFGELSYANFNLTVLDHGGVTIGSRVLIGPNCTLVTVRHPLHPEDRKRVSEEDGSVFVPEHTAPIRIGDRCWLASSVTVCPGVTIGEGCTIGAGSVVTRDIPPYSFAAGVPCRVIRPITEEDRMPELG